MIEEKKEGIKKETAENSFCGFQEKQMGRESSDSLTGNDAMPFEGAGGGEFAETMPDHVFRNENGSEGFPVVDIESVSDEFGDDHGSARPGFDRLLDTAGLFHFLYFLNEEIVDERTFLN